jgi:hypothetical protein
MGAFVMPALVMSMQLASCIARLAAREDRSSRVGCCSLQRAAAGALTAAKGTVSCQAQGGCECQQQPQACSAAARHDQSCWLLDPQQCSSGQCNSWQLESALAKCPPASCVCLAPSSLAQQAVSGRSDLLTRHSGLAAGRQVEHTAAHAPRLPRVVADPHHRRAALREHRLPHAGRHGSMSTDKTLFERVFRSLQTGAPI